jgi:hypothetical protein
LRYKGIYLLYSDNFPCIHAGRLKHPSVFPCGGSFSYILKASSLLKFHPLCQVLVNFLYDQLCTHVPMQRYTNALSTLQWSSLVEKSRQKGATEGRTHQEAQASGVRVLHCHHFLVAGGHEIRRWRGGTKSGYDYCSPTASTHSSVWTDPNNLVRDGSPPCLQHHPGMQVTVVHAHFLQSYSGWLVMRPTLYILCLLWLFGVRRTNYAHS